LLGPVTLSLRRVAGAPAQTPTESGEMWLSLSLNVITVLPAFAGPLPDSLTRIDGRSQHSRLNVHAHSIV
jgi:hypothetical protein